MEPDSTTPPFLATTFVETLPEAHKWALGHETLCGDWQRARDYFADLSEHLPKRVYPPRDIVDGRLRARFRAEERFFRPKRSRKRERLAEAIDALAAFRWRHRGGCSNNNSSSGGSSSASDIPPIPLDGVSARWRITVERLFAERLFALRGAPQDFEARFEKVPCPTTEHFTLGDTDIRCATGGRRSWLAVRRASVLFDNRETAKADNYDGIVEWLRTCVEDDQASGLASVLIDMAHGIPVVADKDRLARFYNIDIEPELHEFALDLFRKVYLHLCVKEPAGWLSSAYLNDDAERFKAGLSVSLARALLLLKDKKLTLEQFLAPGGGLNPYAVKRMDDESNWPDVLDACADIDEMYKKAYGVESLNAEQGHRDLLAVFGGESDTEGSEYSDEEEWRDERTQDESDESSSSSSVEDDDKDDDDDFINDGDSYQGDRCLSASSDESYESDFVDDRKFEDSSSDDSDSSSSAVKRPSQTAIRKKVQKLGKSVRAR